MIAIGCDHGGFALKQEVMRHLDELGLAYKDFGTYSKESCDYPIYGEAVARAVAGGECERGILICGTGIGISISANKVKGIRARRCFAFCSLHYIIGIHFWKIHAISLAFSFEKFFIKINTIPQHHTASYKIIKCS